MWIPHLYVLISALMSSASASNSFFEDFVGVSWFTGHGDSSLEPRFGRVYHVLGKKGGNPMVPANDESHDDIIVEKDDLLYGFRYSGTLFWDFAVDFDTRWDINQQASTETSEARKVDWCFQFASRWKEQYKMKPHYDLRLYCQVKRHRYDRNVAILKLMFWTHGKDLNNGQDVETIKEDVVKPVVKYVTGIKMTFTNAGYWDDIKEDRTYIPKRPLMDDREDPNADNTCARLCGNEDNKSLQTLASCKADCKKCWHLDCAEELYKEALSKDGQDGGTCPGCGSQVAVAKDHPPIPDDMRKFYGKSELKKGEDFPNLRDSPSFLTRRTTITTEENQNDQDKTLGTHE